MVLGESKPWAFKIPQFVLNQLRKYLSKNYFLKILPQKAFSEKNCVEKKD
jgi:hypothetical protein